MTGIFGTSGIFETFGTVIERTSIGADEDRLRPFSIGREDVLGGGDSLR